LTSAQEAADHAAKGFAWLGQNGVTLRVRKQSSVAGKEPSLLLTLYSARHDHATIGSVTEEVFVGPAGRAAWEEFVQHVSTFEVVVSHDAVSRPVLRSR
jgi:hypothetical protein